MFEHRFQINFVDQNARPGISRELSDLLKGWFVNDHAARIVQIRQDNQSRRWSHLLFQRGDVNFESVFESSWKPFDLRAKVLRDREKGIVSWPFDQHFVAMTDKGAH